MTPVCDAACNKTALKCTPMRHSPTQGRALSRSVFFPPVYVPGKEADEEGGCFCRAGEQTRERETHDGWVGGRSIFLDYRHDKIGLVICASWFLFLRKVIFFCSDYSFG